jgi:hypothetical protein
VFSTPRANQSDRVRSALNLLLKQGETMSNSPPKPALQSLTLRSILAVAIAAVASKFSVNLPVGAAQDIAGAAFDLVTTLGLIGAAIGRARATTPLN